MEFDLPHRLSFLSAKECHACRSVKDVTVPVKVSGSGSMFGWDVCTSPECREKARAWAEKSSIPERDLIEVFGETVTVMRSSGVIQHGWKISGDGYVGIDPTPEWFVNLALPGQHKRKLATLEELELWNQVQFPSKFRFT